MARNTADDYRPAADDSGLPLFACQRQSPTSVAAAKSQTPERVATQRSRILELLAAAGPLTDEQIGERLGLSLNAVRPRRVKLVEDGLVVAVDENGRTRAGRAATRWGRV